MLDILVSPAKRLNRSRCRLGEEHTLAGLNSYVLDGIVHRRHLANTIE